MALKLINTGKFVNDGTGDDLRTAFEKVNDNFSELVIQQGQNNTVSNLGTGAGIFKEKLGVDLKFKSILAGGGISITQTANEIIVENTESSALTIGSNDGTLVTTSPNLSFSIVGGDNTQTQVIGSTIKIDTVTNLFSDTLPTLSTNLDANSHNILNVNNLNASAITSVDFFGRFNGAFIGTLTGNQVGNSFGLVHDIDIRDHNTMLTSIDFGGIYVTATNIPQLILSFLDIDFGNMLSPSTTSYDAGTII
jgi:hypothetical protein